jgi:hypothetical protein
MTTNIAISHAGEEFYFIYAGDISDRYGIIGEFDSSKEENMSGPAVFVSKKQDGLYYALFHDPYTALYTTDDKMPKPHKNESTWEITLGNFDTDHAAVTAALETYVEDEYKPFRDECRAIALRPVVDLFIDIADCMNYTVTSGKAEVEFFCAPDDENGITVPEEEGILGFFIRYLAAMDNTNAALIVENAVKYGLRTEGDVIEPESFTGQQVQEIVDRIAYENAGLRR